MSIAEKQKGTKGKSKLGAFLISFLVGGIGVDWFYLSNGHAGYIVAGVFKLLTFGGIGIWWLVDWIRILTDSFPDGDGVELKIDM
jgi:TM2 domain-containing membrane protein YozV